MRQSIHNDIASLSASSGSVDLRVVEFKAKLRVNIVKWLGVLNTRNVSRDVLIDNDFNIQFGSEKVNQFKGSTLLRVILAVRASFFEIYVAQQRPAIEFLIFDTPRQQDIESADFAKFIEALKGLASSADAQIVFSTTEYHYKPGENDCEWIPNFPGKEQNMFFGTHDM